MSDQTNQMHPAAQPKQGNSVLWILLVLAAGLSLLFAKSFQPNYVLFANDAPLGALKAQADIALSNFLGAWQDLNWIGEQAPSALPNLTYGFYLVLGPVGYAKFMAPLSLLLLGLSTWLLLWSIGFSGIVCLLGALALALNSDPFSYACWGLPSLPLSMCPFLWSLAAIASFQRRPHWAKLVLAGLATGFAVMEGYDNGAIFSLYSAAFLVFVTATEAAPTGGRKAVRGLIRLAVITAAAVFIAAQALTTLVGTQLQGNPDTAAAGQTAAEKWDFTTQWSLPKMEALRVIIPGVFGYRMDTAEGGAYWGTVGQQPGWDQHHQGTIRYSGSGVYCGILVVLGALWALTSAAQGARGPFDQSERRAIWFWTGAALVSLLFSFGRHAPFYWMVYLLPTFSNIRNPIKFMHPFSVALVVLFAYGIQGLLRKYAMAGKKPEIGLGTQLNAWRRSARGFERKWIIGSVAALVIVFFCFAIFAGSRQRLAAYLQTAGFDQNEALAISGFSVAQVGWFLLFLALSLGLLLSVMSGWFRGSRLRIAGLLFGALLMIDLARANTPWIVYYDYQARYALNPVVDFLRKNPEQHRTTGKLMPLSANYLVNEQGQRIFPAIYNEWLQNHFQYYHVQSLDIIQAPRMPAMDKLFMNAFLPTNQAVAMRPARLWQLTNTRYILAQSGFVELLNSQLDPVQHRFKIAETFNFVAKQAAPTVRLEDITTVVETNGAFAIIEFSGALPRAKLFSQWQTISDEHKVIETLLDPAFDPWQKVVVAAPIKTTPSTNAEPGTSQISSYSPKKIRIDADAKTAAVLLLNDRYDPNWKVRVDGRPAELLRCNYIMKGVELSPGRHQVEFEFAPTARELYISLAGIFVGIGLLGILGWQAKQNPKTR